MSGTGQWSSTTVFEFFKSFREAPPKKKLKLPRRFVRLHGETLSNVVFLKLPCGSEWEIGLTKNDGKVWLNQGWPEFATRYSLDQRRLLFFRYKGNSRFAVSIFGKTTCQICYDPVPANSVELDIDEDNIGTRYDNPVLISDSLSLFSNPEVESPPPSADQWKENTPGNSTSDKDSVASNSEIEVVSGNKGTGFDKKARAVGGASFFRFENPFFIVTLGASYTTTKAHFYIPKKFARTYLPKVECDAILKVSDGRSWSVQYKVRGRLDQAPRAEFCCGWFSFMRDNNLEEGDICTFELINRNNISFNVFIVKANCHQPLGKLRKQRRSYENTGCKLTRNPSSLNISRASVTANKFFSTNPCFQVDFSLDHLEKKNKLTLPPFFAKSYLEEKSQTVTLESGGRSWPVKLLAYPSLYRFSGGWSAFLRENSLRPGDVLIFELIKRIPVVFKVSIFSEAC